MQILGEVIYIDQNIYKCSVGQHGYAFHVILKEEQRSFSQWINANLGSFPELAHLLPLKDDGGDLYEKIADGILLW